MTKQEILANINYDVEFPNGLIPYDEVIKSMDQYAKQEALVAFNAARQMREVRRRSDMWAAATVSSEYVYESFTWWLTEQQKEDRNCYLCRLRNY